MNVPLQRLQGERLTDLGAVILFCKSLRAWTFARANGQPAQQAVFAVLNARECGLLAPVLDGLFTCAQASLGRALQPSCGCAISADESWLAALIGFAVPNVWTPDRQSQADSDLLDAAANSAQVMVRLVLGPNPADPTRHSGLD
jgi:hypothetical protein